MRPSLVGHACALIAATVLLLPVLFASASARHSLEELVSAVVRIKTFINPEGRTTQNLGREREGSGIVIDSSGLVLTIGYLMVEAHAAELVTQDGRTVAADVVGYDHETGFGLLRATAALNVRPMPMGKSAELKAEDPVLVASFGGRRHGRRRTRRGPARVRRQLGVPARGCDIHRPAPPALERCGADQSRGQAGRHRLAGGRRRRRQERRHARQHVRADRPAAADPGRADGRGPHAAAAATMARADDRADGRAADGRARDPAGPAEKAGVQRGDVVLGVGGKTAKDLADFYRKVWALGSAGTTVPVDMMQGSGKRRIDIPSMSRYDHLKLKSTF